MPITIPKTWASNEVLDASDMNANLNAIKEGVAGTDSTWWTTGQWIEAKHIVNPVLETVQNATHNVSGYFVSQSSGALFTSGSFISGFESAVGRRMIVPKTSIIIPVAHPCTWFYQLWACVESRSDEDATRGNAELHSGINGAASVYSAAVMQEQETNKSIASGRTYANTYSHGTQATPADLKLTISAFGTEMNAQLVSWGFTVECFYI
tara:strand:- start:1171 stop:1797 length:627 start_codon:yes stop_codon:yes gene_type:complete